MMKRWMAYSYRVPLCVPFWNKATYWHLLKTILSGRVIGGPSIQQLNKVLSQYFSVPEVLLCVSGRVAIGLALRAMEIKAGQEVIVPSFCCQSVLDPILGTGARPVFADVGNEISLTVETVEACLTNRTAVVLVPHLFGNPVDIEKIVELCQSRRIWVIDDAAQALGATLNGRLLGTFGDAGVVSFGNGKVCFGTGGGLLLSDHPHILESAKTMVLNPTGYTKAISHALSVLVRRRWRKWSLPIYIALSKFRRGGKGPAVTNEYETMRNLEASVALTLFNTLQDNLCRRRKHVERYKVNLGQHRQITLVPHAEGSSHLSQVIQVAPNPSGHSQREQIIQTLKREGFEVTASYTPLHLLPRYQPYAKEPLKNIERIWEHLIELPTEPFVLQDDIDQISEIVARSLN